MANLEVLLSEVKNQVDESVDVDLEHLDEKIQEASRKDVNALLGDILSLLGSSGTGGTLRETGADTVLGHVKFTCPYYAPDCGKPVSRQDKRKRERAKEKEKEKKEKGKKKTNGKVKGTRRKKNGDFARIDEATCAYPFKEKLKLVDGMTSALALKHNEIAAFTGSFGEGSKVLKHQAGVVMSESTFMRRAYAAGQRALMEQELAILRLALSGKLPLHLAAALTKVVPTLYIMLDGTGVPCTKKDTRNRKGKDGKPAKTREIKVGVIGTYQWKDARGRPVRDPRGETYVATEKNAKTFGAMLRRVANSRGYGNAEFRIQICGDGADWIENIVKEAFPGKEVIFVNDFYHAAEHLNAFLGCVLEKGEALRKAFRKARGILRRNGGSGLVAHLKKFYGESAQGNKDATRELKYFEKRTEHMKYQEYRKEGLYLGSGIIEAACRTVAARRCKQAGMHWRIHNAAAMCALVARLRSDIPADRSAA